MNELKDNILQFQSNKFETVEYKQYLFNAFRFIFNVICKQTWSRYREVNKDIADRILFFHSNYDHRIFDCTTLNTALLEEICNTFNKILANKYHNTLFEANYQKSLQKIQNYRDKNNIRYKKLQYKHNAYESQK